MSTILIILIFLLPLGVSLIEKSLKSAGKLPPQPGLPPEHDLFPEHDGTPELDELPVQDIDRETPCEEVPQPDMNAAPTGYRTIAEITGNQKEPSPLPVTRGPRKEKIDKKKLVIYSEIMKRRF